MYFLFLQPSSVPLPKIILSKFVCERDDPLFKVLMKKQLLKKYRALFNLRLEESWALFQAYEEKERLKEQEQNNQQK